MSSISLMTFNPRARHTLAGCGAEVSLSNHRSPFQIYISHILYGIIQEMKIYTLVTLVVFYFVTLKYQRENFSRYSIQVIAA